MRKMGKRLIKVMYGIEKFVASQAVNSGGTLVFLVSAPTFGLGGSRLWEKEEEKNISGKKRKRRSIRAKVDLYEVCQSYFIYCLLFYFRIKLTPFFLPPDFRYLSH